MSYADGIAAINLEMPQRVPRTEYSVEGHWKLIERVTGLPVDAKSSSERRRMARQAFMKKWDYGFVWNVLIGSGELDKCRTRMGHAVYEADGSDFDTRIECPFDDPEEAFGFDPTEIYGTKPHAELVKAFNEHCISMKSEFPDTVNTTGTYISLVSGLLEIFGWDMLLMALGIDAAEVGETANRYAKWMQQYFDALADSDAQVIMVHDDIVWTSGAFVHPEWYRKYVFPNYKKYFAPMREAGKKIIYTSDGNYSQFIDDIADCGVNGFVLEPYTDMAYIAEKYGKTHSFIGNADTRILLSGTKDDIYAEVKRCMDIGKKCPGFIMAVGNHIPSNTPVENCLYYNEAFEKLRIR